MQLAAVFKRTSRFKTLCAQAVELALLQSSVFKKVVDSS